MNDFSKYAKVLIKLLWILLNLSIAIPYFNGGEYSGEYQLGFIMLMTIITMPAGTIVQVLLGLIFFLFDSIVTYSETVGLFQSLIIWVFMTIAGYYQWFYLIPKIYMKIKGHSRT